MTNEENLQKKIRSLEKENQELKENIIKAQKLADLGVNSNKKLLKLNVELEEQSEKYRDVFNVPNECIFIHDIDTGVVVDVNKAITSMYG
ncbi:MAG: hypothetical protein ABFS35_03430 [Bacteroidota bacterium]